MFANIVNIIKLKNINFKLFTQKYSNRNYTFKQTKLFSMLRNTYLYLYYF